MCGRDTTLCLLCRSHLGHHLFSYRQHIIVHVLEEAVELLKNGFSDFERWQSGSFCDQLNKGFIRTLTVAEAVVCVGMGGGGGMLEGFKGFTKPSRHC